MNESQLWRTVACLTFCGLSLGLPSTAGAADGEIAVVSARVSEDYSHTRLPDGSFQSETYTFGEGGRMDGMMVDQSVTKLKFIDVARTIAPTLRNQGYLPGTDPSRTKLLLMVYWGMTEGVADPSSSIAYQSLSQASQRASVAQAAMGSAKKMNASRDAKAAAQSAAQEDMDRANGEIDSALLIASMENRQRDRVNWKNAGVLGYDMELVAAKGKERTALEVRYRDLMDELEDNRYFVVLMAYDFQLLTKEKKHKLLWETRYSIRQRGNDFAEQLAAMTLTASRYFGRDSHGLTRKPLPEGHVTLGELKVGEVVPDK